MTKKIKKYTVTVIVLSYNRPKMLREALASIKDADEVILVDDGSDFDVVALAKEFKFRRFSLIGAPPIPIEQRLKKQRLPTLINEALKQASGDIITYLCDDDLLGPEWPATLRGFFMVHGEKYHFVRGHCIRFEYSESGTFEQQTKHLLVFADSPRQVITGNFAHLRKCFSKEKIKWHEGIMVGHDTAFFDRVDRVHDTWTIPLIPAVACYRRIHDKMLTNHVFYNADNSVTIDEFSESAKKLLRDNKFLE